MKQDEVVNAVKAAGGAKTVIGMAREAGFALFYPELELFATLVREDEREKQQEPVAWMNTNPTCSKSYGEGFQQGKQVMFDTFKAHIDELLGTDRMSDGSVLLSANDLVKHEQSMCILKRILGEK